MNKNDLPSKLRKLGINIFNAAKEGIKDVKTNVEQTLLDEHLHKRFNQENPYRFAVVSESGKLSMIDEVSARNAKRYDEDDLFVFYGELDRNIYFPGRILIDLSNRAEYKIKDLIFVTVPVEYNHEIHEVEATAVMTSAL